MNDIVPFNDLHDNLGGNLGGSLGGSLGGKEISLNNNESVQISTHKVHRNRV